MCWMTWHFSRFSFLLFRVFCIFFPSHSSPAEVRNKPKLTSINNRLKITRIAHFFRFFFFPSLFRHFFFRFHSEQWKMTRLISNYQFDCIFSENKWIKKPNIMLNTCRHAMQHLFWNPSILFSSNQMNKAKILFVILWANNCSNSFQ